MLEKTEMESFSENFPASLCERWNEKADRCIRDLVDLIQTKVNYAVIQIKIGSFFVIWWNVHHVAHHSSRLHHLCVQFNTSFVETNHHLR